MVDGSSSNANIRLYADPIIFKVNFCQWDIEEFSILLVQLQKEDPPDVVDVYLWSSENRTSILQFAIGSKTLWHTALIVDEATMMVQYI